MNYDEQIKAVVRSFIQVWNEFESTLARELPSQGDINSTETEKEAHFTTNHDLLYRVGNSMDTQNSLTMGELSAALSVPLSTATRIVDWLVNNGYMQRLHDPEDRRIVRVIFTSEGRTFYQVIDNNINQHLREIANDLSPKELTDLMVLLHKIMTSLKKELSKQHENPAI